MTAEPTGSIEVAIAHAKRLLDTDPQLAEQQALEILRAAPAHPLASLLLGMAQRLGGHGEAACLTLRGLSRQQPNWAAAHCELGLALADGAQHQAALAELRRAVELEPMLPNAWRAIGDQLTIAGDTPGAAAAYAQHLRTSTQDPRLMAAGAALCENRIPEAELLLREHLKRQPTDVAAIRMFAEVAARLGRYLDAETLLLRALELAPSFHGARHNYAIVLHRLNKPVAALQQLRMLLEHDARNPGYRNLQAVVLARLGDYQESIAIYADVLAAHPRQPAIWLSYGHALATAGRESESIAAYRRCIELAPQFGEAYWSLANLKTFRFTAIEVSAMARQLAGNELKDEDRFHFEFARGKALEDTAQYQDSFVHYARGNQLRRQSLDYDAEETTDYVSRCKATWTAALFASRTAGCEAADPIFVVGLPRAGSTLIEQILSSHPEVEGTMELPDIIALSRRLGRSARNSQESDYPQTLSDLTAPELHALGVEYIERTRVQRKTARPFFIDKMPNNFLHLGLIRLILPRAKIIDARRHPMACCFSGFKQHFAKGQIYTYSLPEIGRYYRDYVDLMTHFDAVQPGAVHRVHYEMMIDDFEGEVRRLLEYCALPFDPACLRFHENPRAVRTASSQQVRQPIFRAGLAQWQHFAAWLDPLREALGSALDSYPKF